jgi:hypothetical protein
MSRISSVYRRAKRLTCVAGLAMAAAAAQAGVINSGGLTIPGTNLFDFDSGTVQGIAGMGISDIFWEQITSDTRALRANPFASPSPAFLQGMGMVDFTALDEAALV